MALGGVGVLGIIYAALSLALRLPGIRSFRQSIIAMGVGAAGGESRPAISARKPGMLAQRRPADTLRDESRV